MRAFERGATDPEEFFAIVDPDVEWDASLPHQTPPEHLEPLHGLNAVRDSFHRWWSSWGTYDYEPEEVIDHGDHVVVVIRDRAVRTRSGIEVKRRFAQVWAFRAGKVIRYRNVETKDEALAAVDDRLERRLDPHLAPPLPVRDEQECLEGQSTRTPESEPHVSDTASADVAGER